MNAGDYIPEIGKLAQDLHGTWLISVAGSQNVAQKQATLLPKRSDTPILAT